MHGISSSRISSARAPRYGKSARKITALPRTRAARAMRAFACATYLLLATLLLLLLLAARGRCAPAPQAVAPEPSESPAHLSGCSGRRGRCRRSSAVVPETAGWIIAWCCLIYFFCIVPPEFYCMEGYMYTGWPRFLRRDRSAARGGDGDGGGGRGGGCLGGFWRR